MKKLTQNQRSMIAELRRRGADWTAGAARRCWAAGRSYYLDTRNAAGHGLLRRFAECNREATQE